MVSGCNSHTLGLCILLSDCIEYIASAVNNPYEVVSSEDTLSRVEDFKKLAKEKNDELSERD